MIYLKFGHFLTLCAAIILVQALLLSLLQWTPMMFPCFYPYLPILSCQYSRQSHPSKCQSDLDIPLCQSLQRLSSQGNILLKSYLLFTLLPLALSLTTFLSPYPVVLSCWFTLRQFLASLLFLGHMQHLLLQSLCLSCYLLLDCFFCGTQAWLPFSPPLIFTQDVPFSMRPTQAIIFKTVLYSWTHHFPSFNFLYGTPII